MSAQDQNDVPLLVKTRYRRNISFINVLMRNFSINYTEVSTRNKK